MCVSPLFGVCFWLSWLRQITGGITNVIFKARNAATGEGALVRVYGKDTDLLLDRRCVLVSCFITLVRCTNHYLAHF